MPAILAAKKVGENGKVIGVDMTEEMVEKAKENVLALPVGAIKRGSESTYVLLSRGADKKLAGPDFRKLAHPAELIPYKTFLVNLQLNVFYIFFHLRISSKIFL